MALYNQQVTLTNVLPCIWKVNFILATSRSERSLLNSKIEKQMKEDLDSGTDQGVDPDPQAAQEETETEMEEEVANRTNSKVSTMKGKSFSVRRNLAAEQMFLHPI